jgi:hypothetical protein
MNMNIIDKFISLFYNKEKGISGAGIISNALDTSSDIKKSLKASAWNSLFKKRTPNNLSYKPGFINEALKISSSISSSLNHSSKFNS